MNLSKSSYCRGIQCPKILWLDIHKSDVRDDSVLNQAVFDTGNKVGDLAMGYYGAYTEFWAEFANSASSSVFLRGFSSLFLPKTSQVTSKMVRNGHCAVALFSLHFSL